MTSYNCIVVFDQDGKHILFCKRMKAPYKGLYNFVGGKVESGESSEHAAYRELLEETGVRRCDIILKHFMDITYYEQNFTLELYAGKLNRKVSLIPEKNPLKWLSIDEDFTDRKRYAGDQNIAHIVNVARMIDLPVVKMVSESCTIGADGCRGGWIAARIDHGELRVERFEKFSNLVSVEGDFDGMLVDMAIGLPDTADDIRPDAEARKLLGKKGSSIFPIPSRNAVYAEGEENQKAENIKALGKSLSKQSIAIIPKLREIDTFMQEYPENKERIRESHPEVCFTCMAGHELWSRKKEFTGIEQRSSILRQYQPEVTFGYIWNMAKQLKCAPDDVADAICLAVTANLWQQGKFRIIPENPQKDRMNLEMAMIIPDI